MHMPTRTLGRNGPQVSSIGLGLMSFAGWYQQQDTSLETAITFLDRAYHLGECFWDTADVYTNSEARIGEWLKRTGKRDDIFLAKACTKSLETLGISTINLYYCHRIDEKTPIEQTIQAMVERKTEGKIRYLGLSECTAVTIRRAHAVHPISAYQVEYSLLFLDIESPKTDILRTCRELGIAIIPYSPIGRGLLTGAFKSRSDIPAGHYAASIPKYSNENFPKIIALVDRIKAIGERHSATPAQICLAWVAAQGQDFIPIPGTTTVSYLDENVKAVDVQLSDLEIAELRKYAEATEQPGDRYPADTIPSVFRDSVPL